MFNFSITKNQNQQQENENETENQTELISNNLFFKNNNDSQVEIPLIDQPKEIPLEELNEDHKNQNKIDNYFLNQDFLNAPLISNIFFMERNQEKADKQIVIQNFHLKCFGSMKGYLNNEFVIKQLSDF
ncbi:hypothetical protein M0811_02111 [Anaeramoeba ignava]|uniref:Uncharacterized protein n=1 Tax=Anaeramoeba ignava TaxID=1746090 RepID=A0A9Q0LBA9_ANAIG|nr:hypothetical protein M0811_02111 [Anaeramoeba ignava]|eukprot:Anaeramoba_ignava/a244561_12.p1 GENE.a244561_12~~a244561_12.p1  ORF type:complete len:129 (-),score=49.77 a244561_12:58-444(-)